MKTLIPFFGLFFLISGCQREKVEPGDDNELITTIKVQFKSITNPSSAVKTFYWRDVQGDGVVDSVDPIILDKNSTYDMEIALLDETKKPAFDITKEIKEEGDVHLFVYQTNPVGLLAFKIKDLDKNGLAVGLETEVKSQYAPGNGKFTVLLKHQPPVNGKAVKNGSEEGGSTDVDITFPVTVK
jgi:hypothetical protein